MITMKRSLIEDASMEETRNVGVQLLERPESRTRDIVVENNVNESTEEARIRMQRNLNRLLNYDRVVEEPAPVEEVAPAIVESATLEEDIRPTSTTLQFGDGNGEQLLKDLNVSRENATATKESYRLSSKGKLVVVLYALVIAVIVTLIAINTGVLASLNNVSASKGEQLNGAQSGYEDVKAEIDSATDTDYIISEAEKLNMVPRA